jgi:hypothetical protein
MFKAYLTDKVIIGIINYTGLAGWLQIALRFEESPYSEERKTGEIPGWGNLSDRATETNRP